MTPEALNLILGLVSAAVPGITNVILAFKHPDGSATVTVILDQSDAQITANQKTITDWMTSHNRTVAPAK